MPRKASTGPPGPEGITKRPTRSPRIAARKAKEASLAPPPAPTPTPTPARRRPTKPKATTPKTPKTPKSKENDTPTDPQSSLGPRHHERIVVLGVGSQNCRMGFIDEEMFATREDVPKPISCPHVLARRIHSTPPALALAPPSLPADSADLQARAIEQTRRTAGLDDGTRPEHRALITPRREVDERAPPTLASTGTPEFLVGRDALVREGDAEYQLIWPIRHGRLHLWETWCPTGRTAAAMRADLALLWSSLLRERLDVEGEWGRYRVMLLIPDQFLRKHVRLMLSVLLDDMGFSAAFVHQESVCAAFGAGLSTACVVDIGHEKTTVSCVDEGISISRARAYYNYGGKDVQDLLRHLLCTSPYYALGESGGEGAGLHAEALEGQQGIVTIKESLCHLDFEDDTPKLFDLVLRQRGRREVQVYPLRLHEELILAPMGLFQPDMFGPLPVGLYMERNSDYLDPYDCVDSSSYVDMGGALGRYAEKDPKERVQEIRLDPLVRVSVDEAIVSSVQQLATVEQCAKMLTNIVLAGGGSLFPYLNKAIEEMVTSRLKSVPVLAECAVEVLVLPPNVESPDLSWKGAAVVATTPSVQECWIGREDWKQSDIRAVRERACFRWGTTHTAPPSSSSSKASAANAATSTAAAASSSSTATPTPAPASVAAAPST